MGIFDSTSEQHRSPNQRNHDTERFPRRPRCSTEAQRCFYLVREFQVKATIIRDRGKRTFTELRAAGDTTRFGNSDTANPGRDEKDRANHRRNGSSFFHRSRRAFQRRNKNSTGDCAAVFYCLASSVERGMLHCESTKTRNFAETDQPLRTRSTSTRIGNVFSDQNVPLAVVINS